MHYVYVLDLLSYGPKPRAKVGIAKNVKKRVAAQFYCYGGLVGHLVGFFCFPDKSSAFGAELATIDHFPHSRTVAGRPREVFDIAAENVVSFIKDNHPSIYFVRVG